MNDRSAKPAIEMVTLKQLCIELKVDPREARERLRLALRDATPKQTFWLCLGQACMYNYCGRW
jgi:hypothetical protein